MNDKSSDLISQVGSQTHQDLAPIKRLIRRAIDERVTPGCALHAITLDSDGRITQQVELYEGHMGYEEGSPRVDHKTQYDLASLTKPFACALWFATLVTKGILDPDRHIGEVISCSDDLLAASPIWRLANHSSGLPAHHRYYEGLAGALRSGASHQRCKEHVRRMLRGTKSTYLPGEKSVYSDLGYLLLELICEVISGETIQQFWSDVSHDWGIHYRPLGEDLEESELRTKYAPTEQCPWRQKHLTGEVHDDNAWVLGGACGHAGLFGTASEVTHYAAKWLSTWRGDQGALPASPEVVQWMLSHHHRAPQKGSFVLGWDTPSQGYSSAGQYLSGHTVGHLGFTGTSIWMELERGTIITLLTNRVSPDRHRKESIRGIRWLRPALNDAVWKCLRG